MKQVLHECPNTRTIPHTQQQLVFSQSWLGKSNDFWLCSEHSAANVVALESIDDVGLP
jgi:hypothetical protein